MDKPKRVGKQGKPVGLGDKGKRDAGFKGDKKTLSRGIGGLQPDQMRGGEEAESVKKVPSKKSSKDMVMKGKAGK